MLGSKDYVLPSGFGDYFINKAKRLISVQNSMSSKQWNKIDETYRKDLDRAANSESMKAMDYDVILFGNDAFTNEK